MDIWIKIIVPIITAVAGAFAGFCGGCKYTKGKQVNSSNIDKNSTNNSIIQINKD